MHGIVGQLSPIEWGPITSNIFLGYTKQNGDFDAGSFLGGSNYALGLKNTYEKNGIKASLNPMIGFQSVSITDYDIEYINIIKQHYNTNIEEMPSDISKLLYT